MQPGRFLEGMKNGNKVRKITTGAFNVINKVLYVGNYTKDIAINKGIRYDKQRGSFFIKVQDKEIEVHEDPNRMITTDKNDCIEDLTHLLGKLPQAVEKLGHVP